MDKYIVNMLILCPSRSTKNKFTRVLPQYNKTKLCPIFLLPCCQQVCLTRYC